MVRRHRLLAILVFAAMYYGAARLGLSLASLPGNVSPVWPPTGLAIAALVLWGLDLAPFVFLGALATNFFTPVPHLAAFGMAAGNTLEAVIAAYAFRRSTGLTGASARTGQILRATTVGAGLATSLSATAGIASLVAAGVMPASDWWSSWRVWWVGDALGALVVGGFMLVWARERRRPKGGPVEAGLLLVGTVVTSVLIFSSDIALPYLLFPFVIWAALRYFWRGATATTLVISAIAVVFTAHGEGHFAHDISTDGLWTLDVYLAVLAITGLVLATVVAERDNAMARASQLSDRLQQQVDDLRYQQSLRDAQRLSKVGFWRINVKTRELEWSDVMYELCGLDPATFTPTLDAFFDLVHPDDAEATRTAILEALTTGDTWTGDLRIVHSSGETRVLWGEAEAERNEAGELVSLRGVRQDVTELRLTAERLREAEEAA